MTDFEYDPERALWRPGRRSFLFLMGGALVGTILEPGPALVEAATVRAPRGRVPYVDPRRLWEATMRELHGDDSLTRELGMEPFRVKVYGETEK